MVFQCTNPVRTNRVEREMDRLFSAFFGEHRQPMSAGRPAAVNVWGDDEAWFVEAELPGVSPDQLEISVLNDELTISVDRPEPQEDGATCYRRERPHGSFTRSLKLPTAIDADQVSAELKHGVLTLTLPKAETARRRKIAVNPGE